MSEPTYSGSYRDNWVSNIILRYLEVSGFKFADAMPIETPGKHSPSLIRKLHQAGGRTAFHFGRDRRVKRGLDCNDGFYQQGIKSRGKFQTLILPVVESKLNNRIQFGVFWKAINFSDGGVFLFRSPIKVMNVFTE